MRDSLDAIATLDTLPPAIQQKLSIPSIQSQVTRVLTVTTPRATKIPSIIHADSIARPPAVVTEHRYATALIDQQPT